MQQYDVDRGEEDVVGRLLQRFEPRANCKLRDFKMRCQLRDSAQDETRSVKRPGGN